MDMSDNRLFNTGFFDSVNQWMQAPKDFNYFRFPVFEYVGGERYVKFEILVMSPHRFSVRMPEFDYIKSGNGACVEYDSDQMLCFLLAYDKKQCHEFIKQLWLHAGVYAGKVENKLSEIPIFKEFYREKEKLAWE